MRKICGFALALTLAAWKPVVAAEAGDLWQVTSAMSMPGMPAMPSRASSTCMATTWSQPPGGANSSCTRTDFHVDGAKATWTETCANPSMTGHGEITRQGSEAFSGAITFVPPQGMPAGNMVIKIDGRRVGDCDAAQ